MVINPLVFKVHKALRASLAQDEHYLLAVSGGSDSMALLAACWQLQSEGWGRYSVCHVEHGLRGEESLRDICQRFAVRMSSVVKMNGFSADYKPREGDTIVLRGKRSRK